MFWMDKHKQIEYLKGLCDTHESAAASWRGCYARLEDSMKEVRLENGQLKKKLNIALSQANSAVSLLEEKCKEVDLLSEINEDLASYNKRLEIGEFSSGNEICRLKRDNAELNKKLDNAIQSAKCPHVYREVAYALSDGLEAANSDLSAVEACMGHFINAFASLKCIQRASNAK